MLIGCEESDGVRELRARLAETRGNVQTVPAVLPHVLGEFPVGGFDPRFPHVEMQYTLG